MKKTSVLAAFFCLLFATTAIFAQSKATNFAGNWELDLTKSKLPERVRIESMTMNVTQTDKEIKVETTTKRPAPPEGAPGAGGGAGGSGGGMGRGGGGGMGGGSSTVSYSLDEKEMTSKVEASGNMPASTTALKAMKEKDGKLKLTSNRSFETPNGTMTSTSTETWELVDGGKGLKVTRNTESSRGGAQSWEMYFTKKDSSKAATPRGIAGN